KKTIQENASRIRHLWMHDPFQPPTAAIRSMREVGKDELPDEVLSAFPDATGGLEVVREYLSTPRGDEILEGIRQGGINEMSFAYDVVKSRFSEVDDGEGAKRQVRLLSEVRLFETSDVLWGANAATVASKTLDYRLAQLEASAAEMSADVKAGRVLSAANLNRLKEALAVLSSILLAAEPPDDDAKARATALTEQIRLRLAIAERNIYTVRY
ncbi:MAG TPA: HK97 family phage prohead protease, partial [Promineifilum sp.]